jgi:formylglycine-generating enzyme required for sulfatase activity
VPAHRQQCATDCGDPARYRSVRQTARSTSPNSNHPVDQVSWEDAVEFCKRLSELPEERAAGRVYRLPTESKWEYACRAGGNAPFGFGGLELAEDYGWFNSNSQGLSQPVGQKNRSDWGLYDMHGNVMEWCSDWAGDYPEGAVSDPTGPKEGDLRMKRGGDWMRPAVLAKSGCRMSGFPPDTRSNYVGFRVALSSPDVSNEPERSQDNSSGAGRN